MTVALAAVDALRGFLPVPTGATVDESAAVPAKYVPARLYVWPDVALPQRLEERGGRWPEADLRVRLVYTVAAKGEPRVQARDRGVSEALDAWLGDAHEAIRAHARHPLWWDAYIEQVRFDAVRSPEVRGVGVLVVLRLIADITGGGS